MKNLFFLVVIITLPLIAFFQFQNWRKFHPPKDYTEEPSNEIDVDYHNPELVLEYYTLLQHAATYARYCWKEYGVDVRSDYPSDSKKQVYLKTYENYIATARMLKQKLLNSAKWKEAGYSNEEIKFIESQGNMPKELHELLRNKVVAKIGDENQIVFKVQQDLVEKGYTMPIDGVFKTETEDALKNFQQNNQLYPSGVIDRITLDKLYGNSPIIKTDSLNQNP